MYCVMSALPPNPRNPHPLPYYISRHKRASENMRTTEIEGIDFIDRVSGPRLSAGRVGRGALSAWDLRSSSGNSLLWGVKQEPDDDSDDDDDDDDSDDADSDADRCPQLSPLYTPLHSPRSNPNSIRFSSTPHCQFPTVCRLGLMRRPQ